MQEEREKFGKFELERRLALGGMAEIFLAVERGFGGFERHLVVKRIRQELTREQDFVTMFTDEARLVSKLSHPNIANVYDFGEVENVYYLTMEYVDGLTVAQIIRRRKSGIPLEITLRIVGDVCAGLHYAHDLTDDQGNQLNVVHRDVSPQNVMIAMGGTAKLIDFGVARAATQMHQTAVGQLKGKLSYMAPELLVPTTDRVVDRRADVFAAGVLLYEMLTGKRLFKRKSQAQTLMAVRDDNPPMLEPMGFPAEVDVIIGRAVEKDPDKRYPSAQEMQEAIEELIVELISRGSKLITPHRISRFVEEYVNLPDGVDDDESNSDDYESDDTLPGEDPKFSFDDLPVMPGGTPVPAQAKKEGSSEDQLPNPPCVGQAQSANPTLFVPPPAPLASSNPPPIPGTIVRRNKRALMLGAVIIFCFVLAIIVGFTVGTLSVRNDPTSESRPSDVPASVSRSLDPSVSDKENDERP